MTDFPDNLFSEDAEYAHKVALTLVVELFSACIQHIVLHAVSTGNTGESLAIVTRLTDFVVENFGSKTPETLTVGQAYDIALNCGSTGRTYMVEVDTYLAANGLGGDVTASEVLDDILAVLA